MVIIVDYSLVVALSDYLLDSCALTKVQLRTFHPGICNRLDRNTSGIVVAGKSIYGLQTMTAAFKERTLHKYYLCIVKGNVEKRSRVKGYLYKNERTNKVTILQNAPKEKEKDIFDKIMALPGLNIFEGFYKKYKEMLLYLFFGGMTAVISIGSYSYCDVGL